VAGLLAPNLAVERMRQSHNGFVAAVDHDQATVLGLLHRIAPDDVHQHPQGQLLRDR